MIDNNILFSNPLVLPGYYFAKVIDVEAEQANHYFPKLQVTLELHPMYGLPKGTYFRSIIHPSDKAYYHYKNFFITFMPGKDKNDLDQAIGKWGSVEVYSSEFADIEYSAVRFCYQPLWVRFESYWITQEEKENG